jgi:hypothetical protein
VEDLIHFLDIPEELAACHPSAAYNFQVDSKFGENLRTVFLTNIFGIVIPL